VLVSVGMGEPPSSDKAQRQGLSTQLCIPHCLPGGQFAPLTPWCVIQRLPPPLNLKCPRALGQSRHSWATAVRHQLSVPHGCNAMTA